MGTWTASMDLIFTLYRHCWAQAPRWYSISSTSALSRAHVEGVRINRLVVIDDLADVSYRHCWAHAPQRHSIYSLFTFSRTHVEGVSVNRLVACAWKSWLHGIEGKC